MAIIAHDFGFMTITLPLFARKFSTARVRSVETCFWIFLSTVRLISTQFFREINSFDKYPQIGLPALSFVTTCVGLSD